MTGKRRQILVRVAALLAGALLGVLWLRCERAGRPPTPESEGPPPSLGALWDDPSRCLAEVRGGARVAKKAGSTRFASWSLRWFPDGSPGEPSKGPTTKGIDVEWLACAIAHLDVDVLALQEVKTTADGLRALGDLGAKLTELNGGVWRWQVDACPEPGRQHVALLYRFDRVEVSAVESHADFDPTGDSPTPQGVPGCRGRLRPALGAYVRTKGGLDLHVASVHLDGGTEARDFANRREAWTRLGRLFEERQALVADRDLLVLGNFNSVGCPGAGVADAAAERLELGGRLGQLGLELLPGSLACTDYDGGRGVDLDGAIVSHGMREAEGAQAIVRGVCAAASCRALPQHLPFLEAISDHCPLLVDLLDRDLD